MADASLKLAQFTVECWFKRGPFGVAHLNMYPLVFRGRVSNQLNYAMGVRNDTFTLRGYYEQENGFDRPIEGSRVLAQDVWYHGAYVRAETVSRLYVNAVLDAEVTQNEPPNTAGDHPLAIGTSMLSTGAASGRWHGSIRNVRIWNYPLTPEELEASALAAGRLAGASGLVFEAPLDRESFAPGSEPYVSVNLSLPGYSSAPAQRHAVTVGPGPLIQRGHALFTNDEPPYSLDAPPDITVAAPDDGATVVGTTATLEVSLDDPEGNANVVEFWGRAYESPPNFTIAPLPDTQEGPLYAPEKVPVLFQWLYDQAETLNLKAVLSLGDCVYTSNNTQWTIYSDGVAIIEVPKSGYPDGIPYLHALGNHDQGASAVGNPEATTLANTYFPVSRFEERAYYVGHFGDDNDNNAIRFEVAPGKYVTAISLEWDYYVTRPDQIAWARSIAETYPDDIVIICSHYILTSGSPGYLSPQGQAIYDAVKDLPQVRFLLSGHFTQSSRVLRYRGNRIDAIMADYQFSTDDMYVRLMEFRPRDEIVRSTTYNTTDLVEVRSGLSEFDLPFRMPGAPPYQLLGTVSADSGGTAEFDWTGLTPGQHYEWFARARNGKVTRDSERRGFTVEE